MNIISSLLGLVGGGMSQSLVIALIALGIFGGGYLKGAASERADIAQEQLDMALAYAGEIVAQQGRADSLSDENDTLRSAQAPKDRIITQEITRYVQVTRPADRCNLPGTWRLRHDAAATGTPASAEAGSMADAATDPVEDATALETVGENYVNCREDKEKLAGWQRRYRLLEAKNETPG